MRRAIVNTLLLHRHQACDDQNTAFKDLVSILCSRDTCEISVLDFSEWGSPTIEAAVLSPETVVMGLKSRLWQTVGRKRLMSCDLRWRSAL
jgi:hypothetical protein